MDPTPETFQTGEHATEVPPEATVICCEASLDITGVRDLADRLQQARAAGRPLVLDGTQVERADTAALQLLCALFQDAEADHWDVQWHQPSVALQNAAQLLNVSAHLALPAA